MTVKSRSGVAIVRSRASIEYYRPTIHVRDHQQDPKTHVLSTRRRRAGSRLLYLE